MIKSQETYNQLVLNAIVNVVLYLPDQVLPDNYEEIFESYKLPISILNKCWKVDKQLGVVRLKKKHKSELPILSSALSTNMYTIYDLKSNIDASVFEILFRDYKKIVSDVYEIITVLFTNNDVATNIDFKAFEIAYLKDQHRIYHQHIKAVQEFDKSVLQTKSTALNERDERKHISSIDNKINGFKNFLEATNFKTVGKTPTLAPTPKVPSRSKPKKEKPYISDEEVDQFLLKTVFKVDL